MTRYMVVLMEPVTDRIILYIGTYNTIEETYEPRKIYEKAGNVSVIPVTYNRPWKPEK